MSRYTNRAVSWLCVLFLSTTGACATGSSDPEETPKPADGSIPEACLAALGRPEAQEKCKGFETMLELASSRQRMHDLVTVEREKCRAIQDAAASKTCYDGMEARLHGEEFARLEAEGIIEPEETLPSPPEQPGAAGQ